MLLGLFGEGNLGFFKDALRGPFEVCHDREYLMELGDFLLCHLSLQQPDEIS